jgi:alkanesulfonate monooxygenase SsuD/methylene tetrahydromethanopterin reductase-like flavin-dependent oxidoreductase (luciferase family)
MQFGYFTLSDNHYDNNVRAPNDFIADIIDEAIYAEEVGLHSAWIGEHHFSTLGLLFCPGLVLASVAARTRRIRIAPAVTVRPAIASPDPRRRAMGDTRPVERRPCRFCRRPRL